MVEWCRVGGVVSIDRKVLGRESDNESVLLARYVPNAKVREAWQQFQTFCASAPENISAAGIRTRRSCYCCCY